MIAILISLEETNRKETLASDSYCNAFRIKFYPRSDWTSGYHTMVVTRFVTP